MSRTLQSIGTFLLLVGLTLTASLIVPGFVGAVTPFPLSIDNAVGIYALSTVFVAVTVVLYGLSDGPSGSGH